MAYNDLEDQERSCYQILLEENESLKPQFFSLFSIRLQCVRLSLCCGPLSIDSSRKNFLNSFVTHKISLFIGTWVKLDFTLFK